MTTQATPVPARPAPRPLQRFILVTGASGGIGRATTVRLADTGHLVFAAARRAGDDQALGATAPAGRGGSGSPSGCCTAGLLLAGRWLAARPPSAGRWPTRRPGTARPPGSATRAVSCSRCAAATRRPTWRSRGAASTDPTARAGTAAARQLRAGTVPSPGRPSTTQHDPGDRFLTCNLFAALTNAARRNHHADLASRQDVLRAQLLGGARATQDHQQAIGIAN
jgi:NAD(P)-dependent dehydrogenase (short-subunit alcohol dehydrogenase family)